MGRTTGGKYMTFVRDLEPGQVKVFEDYDPAEKERLDGVRASVLSAAKRAGFSVLTTVDDRGRLLVGRPPEGVTGDGRGRRPRRGG